MTFLSTKRVVYAGRGDVYDLIDGYKVIFHYRVETLSAEDPAQKSCIDDSKLAYPKGYGKPMELIFGKKFRLPVWEQCLKTMRLDEVASFLLPVPELMDYPFVSKQLRDVSKMDARKSSHHDGHCHAAPVSTCMGLAAAAGGLGYPELDDWLKNPSPLLFTFHLIEVLAPEQYERESWSLNAEEKINSVDRLKCEGNESFLAGRLDEACRKYCEALTRLDSLILAEKPGEPEHVALDRKKVIFYANIAECKLKARDFYSAIEACDEALSRDPANVKAFFRRARAHAGAWNFAASRADFETCARLDGSLQTAVRRELESLVDAERQVKQADADQFKNIFK